MAAATAVSTSGRLARLLDSGLMLPLGTSAVTLGFGILITFDHDPVDFRASWFVIPIAHALVGIPFVVRIVAPVLRSIDPKLREAAAVLGASPFRVWWEVDRRIIQRPAAAGAGFAMAVSLGEFGATSFLTRRGSRTIPIEIADALSRPGAASFGRGTALASLLLVLSAVVVLLVDRLAPDGRSW
ncbi:MAG: ABC transporter permease subunit [Ilumatobacteraceae bacterium]